MDKMIDLGFLSITGDGEIIALISIILVLMSSLVRRAMIDREKMEETKKKMKEHQEKLKKISKSGNTKEMQRVQSEFMSLTMEQMKQSFKPMLITFVPFILVFGWLKGEYGNVGTVATILGFDLGWFWWYFICAMVFSLILNKIFKLS